MGLLRKTLNWYARLSPSYGKVAPPYDHVVQIGDPRLRKISEEVPLDKIKSDEVQNTIRKLHSVIHQYNSLGMSAPQIGINMRIFVIEHSAKNVMAISETLRKLKGITVVPFTVFINPVMKVIDYHKVMHMEGCESVQGYTAEVKRYKEVEITAYDNNGEKISAVYKDWPARIVQHELDHLNGKVFTDLMERETFTCTCWDEVNRCQGKLEIPFYRK